MIAHRSGSYQWPFETMGWPRRYAEGVDTYLAVASRREGRRYAARPLAEDAVGRILDAGRLAGSARNRQPWRFLLVETRALVDRLAALVYEPENLLGAALVVAIAVRGGGPTAFDAGRAAQNMLLVAWNEGVASVPNGLVDLDRASELLGLGEDERLAIVLSLGYPEQPRDPERRTAAEWSSGAARKSLDELVTRL